MKAVTLNEVIQDYNSRGFLVRPSDHCFGSLRSSVSDGLTETLGPVARSEFIFGYADDSEDNQLARAHFHTAALKTKLVRILDVHHPARNVTAAHLPCYGLLYDNSVSISASSPACHYIGTYVGDTQLIQNSKLPLVPVASSPSQIPSSSSSSAPTAASAAPTAKEDRAASQEKVAPRPVRQLATKKCGRAEDGEAKKGEEEEAKAEHDASSVKSLATGEIEFYSGDDGGGDETVDDDDTRPNLYISVPIDNSDASSDKNTGSSPNFLSDGGTVAERATTDGCTDTVKDRRLIDEADFGVSVDADEVVNRGRCRVVMEGEELIEDSAALLCPTANSLARLSNNWIPSIFSTSPTSLSTVLAASTATRLLTEIAETQEALTEKVAGGGEGVDDATTAGGSSPSSLLSGGGSTCTSQSSVRCALSEDKEQLGLLPLETKLQDVSGYIASLTVGCVGGEGSPQQCDSLKQCDSLNPTAFDSVNDQKESGDCQQLSFSPTESIEKLPTPSSPEIISRKETIEPSQPRSHPTAQTTTNDAIESKQRRLSNSPVDAPPILPPVTTDAATTDLPASTYIPPVVVVPLASSHTTSSAAPQKPTPPTFPQLLLMDWAPPSPESVISSPSASLPVAPDRDILFPLFYVHRPVLNFSNNAMCASAQTYSSFFCRTPQHNNNSDAAPQNHSDALLKPAEGTAPDLAGAAAEGGRRSRRKRVRTEGQRAIGRKKSTEAQLREGGLTPFNRRIVLPWHPELLPVAAGGGVKRGGGEGGQISSRLRTLTEQSCLTLDGRTSVCPLSFMNDSWSTGLRANCRMCIMYLFDWLPQLVCVSIPGLQINPGDELICDYEFLFGPAWHHTRKAELSATFSVSFGDIFRTNGRCLSTCLNKFAQKT
eukprot:GHVS01051439.1.p1 GENE.GHVS01051439.1~~GHVS01051439.1.p1  ORF type:complete len:885 (+),score=184.62 GHVS01051439.1:164-2818(+)